MGGGRRGEIKGRRIRAFPRLLFYNLTPVSAQISASEWIKFLICAYEVRTSWRYTNIFIIIIIIIIIVIVTCRLQ